MEIKLTPLRPPSLFSVLSMLTGIFSIISLMQHYFDVGLIPIFHDLLSYYHQLLSGTIGIPLRWLFPNAPDVTPDLLALSLVGAGIYATAPNIEYSRFMELVGAKPPAYGWRFFIWMSLGWTGLGFFVLLGMINPIPYVLSEMEWPDIYAGALASLLKVVMIVATFFAFNAFAPSI